MRVRQFPRSGGGDAQLIEAAVQRVHPHQLHDPEAVGVQAGTVVGVVGLSAVGDQLHQRDRGLLVPAIPAGERRGAEAEIVAVLGGLLRVIGRSGVGVAGDVHAGQSGLCLLGAEPHGVHVHQHAVILRAAPGSILPEQGDAGLDERVGGDPVVGQHLVQPGHVLGLLREAEAHGLGEDLVAQALAGGTGEDRVFQELGEPLGSSLTGHIAMPVASDVALHQDEPAGDAAEGLVNCQVTEWQRLGVSDVNT